MEERLVSDTQIANMPLHAITEMLGTDGLLRRFDYEIAQFTPEEQQKAHNALAVASELHATDRRVREPYINHLLRVSMRMIIHYGVTDIDLICAGLLHDSVEDHAKELAGGETQDPKEAAIATLNNWFGVDVAMLVAGVTNPEFDRSGDAHSQYLEHLRMLAQSGEPRLVILKISDFTDNATGLIYTTGPKVPRLARKYYPVIPVLRKALGRSDLPLSLAAVEHIESQLDLTEERLTQLMAA